MAVADGDECGVGEFLQGQNMPVGGGCRAAADALGAHVRPVLDFLRALEEGKEVAKGAARIDATPSPAARLRGVPANGAMQNGTLRAPQSKNRTHATRRN